MTKTKKFWSIKNQADDTGAELLLYGEISDRSWFGDEVTPKEFAEDLRGVGGKNLSVRINSPGGDVFAAQAIYTQLRNYSEAGGSVTVYIDGLAASAATIITCAGDHIVMPGNALFMIHNPKGALMGYYESKELAQYAGALEKIKQTIVEVYARRISGRLTDVQLRHKMDAETWMTAEEAKSLGFVDEIDTEAQVENSLKGGMLVMNSVSCDLSRFKHGDQAEEIIKGFALSHADREKNPKESEEKDMDNKELFDKLKDLLGLGPDPGQEEGNTKPDAEATEIDAAAQERQRILALEALDDRSSAAVTKIVSIAKENGSTAEQVKPYVDAVMDEEEKQKEQAQVMDAIKALIKDQLSSGAVQVAPSMPKDKDEDSRKAAIDEIVALANGERKG